MAGSKPLTRGQKESWAQATGSHVIWKEKPLTSMKKGSWAQVGVKPRRNAGSKSKVQLGRRGRSLSQRKRHVDVSKNMFFNDEASNTKDLAYS